MFHRRHFLEQLGSGFGSLALAGMLHQEQAVGETSPNVAASSDQTNSSGGVVKVLHHPAKAKRVVQLFMAGAASHLDLFDYKPALEKHHGRSRTLENMWKLSKTG